jgi:hypothetical protein
MEQTAKVLKSSPNRLRANHKYYSSHHEFILKIAKDYYEKNRDAIKLRKKNKYQADKTARLEAAKLNVDSGNTV